MTRDDQFSVDKSKQQNSSLLHAAYFPLLYDPYSRSVCSSHDMMYKTRKTLLGHKSRTYVCDVKVANVKDFVNRKGI